MSFLHYFLFQLRYRNRKKRSSAVKKHEKNQRLLKEIALNDKDSHVRWCAIMYLTNQEDILEIVFKDRDKENCEWAIKHLTDQKALTKIALEHENCLLRKFVVKELNDPATLAQIAINDEVYSVCTAAFFRGIIEWVNEPAHLKRVAKEAKDGDVKSMAKFFLNKHKTIGEEKALAVAKKMLEEIPLWELANLTPKTTIEHHEHWVNPSPDWDVKEEFDTETVHRRDQLEAVDSITNPILISDVAQNASDSVVRVHAIEKLTDQRILKKIAREQTRIFSDDYIIIIAALKKLTDQKIVKQIAMRRDQDDRVVRAAIEKLTDKTLLNEIVDKRYKDVSELARDRLKKL